MDGDEERRREVLGEDGVVEDGQKIERGRLYVAPPDRHLLIQNAHVRLSRGPRENGHRPAIDPLFRSAARAYGPRVVGVVLSGNLGDGTLGLRTAQDRGGVTIVQDPDEAVYPSMPQHAIDFDSPDHVLPAAEIAAAVTHLALEPVSYGGSSAPELNSYEDGKIAEISCPDCGGPIWEIPDGGMARYLCRTGHSFSAESLYASQADGLEAALWTAIRVLQERRDLAVRLAGRIERRGADLAARRFRSTLRTRNSTRRLCAASSRTSTRSQTRRSRTMRQADESPRLRQTRPRGRDDRAEPGPRAACRLHRAALDGSDQSTGVFDAVDRRGGRIRCRVTCAPLRNGPQARGVMIVVEEAGEATQP
jgi:CheB methylesterase